MDLKKLEYVIAIADECNITKAAEKVFITRPALNHFLLNLEDELGVKLFERSSRKLILTYAGEIYINAAKKILNIKQQTYKLVEDITDNRIGCIRLGVTHGIGNVLLANVLPKFHQYYPKFTFDLKEANIRNLEAMVEDGTIDFAVVGNGSVPTNLEHITTIACEVVLALPKNHPLGEKAASLGESHNYLDLNELKEEPFILMGKDTNIRAIADKHFELANFNPKILIECRMSTLAYQFVKAGLGPSILMEFQINQADGVHVFSLNPKETWFQSIAFRKDTIFSKADKYFISLIVEFFSNVSPKNIFNPK
jgi:DNA-binding transcriptional LysR family regulator